MDKYEEALQRARELYETGNFLTRQQVGIIFPELRESEDERIRKALINHFKSHSSLVGENWNGIECDDIIAYLEKQKEQKPADLPPGFYFIDLDGNRYYSKEFRYGDMKMKVVEDKLEKPAEWSEEDRLHLANAILSAEKEWGTESCTAKWLKSFPERFYLSPKQEWSEEDEKQIRQIERIVRSSGCSKQLQEKIHNWFKSLRPSWKPSEDEERLINTSISFLKDFADKGYENAVECIDWLKSKLNGNACK